MKNPFTYGEIVLGEDFCDRERELSEMVRDLKDGERIFLISPRRYGKSSLIQNVKLMLEREGYYVAYLDLFGLASLSHFLEIYSKSITSAVETKVSGFTRFVNEFLSSLRPKVVVTPEGLPTIELGYEIRKKDIYTLLDETYELAQKIARKRKRRFVVIFDEFQEIATLDGEKIEKRMRAAFQHHNLVAYLFAGSKRHMMYSMVSDRNRAFYKMARIVNLDRLPKDIFAKFLEMRFKRGGFTLETGILEEIFRIAEEYPYNIQFICHRLWDLKLAAKKIRISDIDEVVESIINDQAMAFIALWDSLSPHQKKLLCAIAKFGGENIQSGEFIRMGNLSSPSSVQTSKKRLIKRDVLDKENGRYFITDVFFKEWINRRVA